MRESNENIKRLTTDLDTYQQIIDNFNKLSKPQHDQPDVRAIIDQVHDQVRKTKDAQQSQQNINDRQLELSVHTEDGVNLIPIEFIHTKKYEFRDNFERAKKDCLGSHRVGPSYMHSVRIKATRGGTKEMIGTAKDETLWISVCDESTGAISHLGKCFFKLNFINYETTQLRW